MGAGRRRGLERGRIADEGGASFIGSVTALRCTIIDSGPAKTAEPDAASLKPARAGIDNHTKANPHTIAMSDPKKTLRRLRRDFSRSGRKCQFIYETRSIPVATILL